jgi:hypothetical protein
MYNRYNTNNSKKKIMPRYNHSIFKSLKTINSSQSSQSLNNNKINLIENHTKNISVVINGRLGNHLFEIISCWAYAKKYNMNFTLDISYQKKYSKYYENFFSKIPLSSISSKYTVKQLYPYENILNRFDLSCINNLLINSYLQNSLNFNQYRDEILSLFFNSDKIQEKNNKFFIHIRLKDFLTSPQHNLNLDNYYKKAIEYLQYLDTIGSFDIDNTNFYIISDDINLAKKKYYLNLLPKENLVFIDNIEYDEIKTLELFKDCSSGAIIGHSTFAWWGAYIINCPTKIVICPNKFLKGNHNFTGFYLNYKIINI